MSGFVHLHLHTEFSLLDGAIRIKELPQKLKELNMSSCAITDHGVMYGTVAFYKAMKAQNIKPIIGSEVYVAPAGCADKMTLYDNGKAYSHLVLLAKDNEGLINLNRLVSKGFIDGFYKKPRVDKELLSKYHEGIICLSACISGEIPMLILEGKYNEAKAVALWYSNLFGKDNFYLEIQCNRMQNQAIVNSNLIKMSRETGIPLVATNDCHYLNKEDYKAHDVLLCIDTGAKITDKNRMRMQTDDFYVKSEDEVREFFKDIPEAIDNTIKIADMCNAEYDFSTIHLPEYEVPDSFNDNKEYLRHLTYNGLEQRYKICGKYDSDENYKKRIEYELSVINGMGYTDYYLIVWDFINYAKSHGIIVGPGRGSGAGSLVAYAVGITNIDPLRYNLVFERFLNAERVSMPDFDVDFCYERRQEVIDYVTEKYGQNKVAQVITFGTLAARLCIRDVARVLDLSYQLADKIAKLIPEHMGITIAKAIEINKELRTIYNTDDKVKEVIDYSMRLEGLPRHTSTHAAGVIISGKPITDIAPLSRNEDSVVVQFAKADIESVGLLKFDFLGLRTLTVMRDTADMVQKRHNVKIDFDSLPLDDKNVFKMIGDGDTAGVFQLESKGMTSFMKELKPNSIEDIIAGISLYRPGPMEQIPKYVTCKHNPSQIAYDHPLLEPILNVTYGCMVYQEQVMQIVRDLAGFSMGQSDNIRRAMSKKNKAMMEKYRELFIYGGTDDNGNQIKGAVNNGVTADIADKIFSDVSNFAGYAFNKSHAAAYAVVGYYTAYLKYYYPVEFMAAMMNSFRFNLSQAAWYIHCAENMGIKILPPDINLSMSHFVPEGDDKIRIGLTVIKNVGEGPVNELIVNRNQNGPFTSFENFLVRSIDMDINRKMVESLIFASALDFTGLTRATMVATIQTELDRLNRSMSNKMNGQMSIFDIVENKEEVKELSLENSVKITTMKEYSYMDKLSYEKEMVGIYLSGHPLMNYKEYVDKLTTFNSSNISDGLEEFDMKQVFREKEVIMSGMLISKNVRTTKNKTQMLLATFEDLYGTYEVVLFGKVFETYATRLEKNNPYILVGKFMIRDDGTPSVIVNKIFDMPDGMEKVKRILADRQVSYIIKYSKEDDENLLVSDKQDDKQNDKQNSEASNVVVTNSSDDNINNMKDIINDNNINNQFINDAHRVIKYIEIKYKGDINDPKYMRILNFLAYFHGDVPVRMILEDNSVLQLDSVCNVNSSEAVINRLIDLCGNDNVRIVTE